MTSSVKQQVNHFSGETQGWNHPNPNQLVVKESGTTGVWEQGETYNDLVSVSASNPYITAYSEVGFRYVIGDVNEVDADAIPTGDTEFEEPKPICRLKSLSKLGAKVKRIRARAQHCLCKRSFAQ